MNHFLQVIVKAYSRILNLYPRKFRDEFADEMQVVFRDSADEAAKDGVLSLALVCLRELGGLPFNILREFWREFQGEHMNRQDLSLMPLKPGSWGDSVWAGLPHFLIAILFASTSVLANTRLGTASGIVLGLLLLIGFLATIYYTWRNHWPTWSASWYGYVGLIIFRFAIAPYRDWNWDPTLKGQIFGGTGSVVLLMLSLAVLLYWLTRRNPIEGLLMAIPVIILYWFPAMEFVPNPIRFCLTIWLFLLPALTATAVTRLNDIKKAVWLVLGASVLSGLPIAYARTYWHNIPEGHFLPPSIGQVAGIFSIQFLAGSALAIGPILGWGLWRLGTKHGQAGRVSARLIVLGMLINLSGHFGYWWWFSHHDFFTALRISPLYEPDQAFTLFMVYAGLAGTLAGSIWLASLSWRESKPLSVSLVLAPLALPLLAMFPIYFYYRIIPPGFSFQIAELNVNYIFLILLAGIVWIVMSGWAITRLYNPSLRERIA
jgi:hypothetical protein